MSNVPYVTTDTVLAAQMGASETDVIAAYGEAGSAQRASAAQAAVSISALTSSTPFGFASKADGDKVLALLEEIRATLVAIGFMKGSA